MISSKYGGAGGHVGRHIELSCWVMDGPVSFLVALMCFLPPQPGGKTPKSSTLS